MKKAIFTFVLALFCIYAINAQDFTSKKGIPILPEKGDYSISIDAVPFFQYLGNMFHGTNYTSKAPLFDFPGLGDIPMWTLQVRKFVSPTTALRARVRLGYSYYTIKNTINDQTNTSTTPAYVDDKWTESRMNIVLGAGLEKRRGKGRVQGYYGVMANIMVSTHGNKVVYGNTMDAAHTAPLSTQYPWVEEIGGGYATENATTRVVKDNDGLGFGIGVNAFLGVEYFFAPKMSIGGEFSWGILFQMQGKSKAEIETWDGSAVKTTTYKSGGTTFIGIDNGNSGGAINLNFYF
jgi:hypothetical protein